MRTRSPFPGMDPWIEDHWNDVHHTFISTLRRQAFPQLPDGLYAAIEENVYVVDLEIDRKSYRPDVGVFEKGAKARQRRTVTDSGGLAVAEPIRLLIPTEPVTEGYIEIRDHRNGDVLVTVIEVLSPTNKTDLRARATYLSKRSSYAAANVNLVELDLLRAGDHLIGVPIEYLDPPSVVPYKCAIRRNDVSAAKIRVDYFPFQLREPLPRISVPLRNGDDDIVLDLQEPVRVAYEEARLGMRVDYSKPPVPPLSPEDTAWAAELFAASV